MRKLPGGWIENYLRLIEDDSEAPHNFVFWSAATVVAASLKRHAWFDRGTYKIYPNMYTCLVAQPGVGKGSAINPAFDVLAEANTAHILSGRLTIEFILDKLSKGFPTTNVTQIGQVGTGTESAAIIVSPEMSVMFRRHSDALADLNDLWDAREQPFPYGTRTKGQVTISHACMSMLSGTAPTYLCRSIPSDAVGGGFTRRCNFVYAKEKSKWIPRVAQRNGANDILKDELVHDLRTIASNVQGEFKLDPLIEADFDDFYNAAKPSEFSDDATQNYITTKPAHAIKLAMALSASRDDSKVINKCDWDKAKKEIEEVEEGLKIVFRAVGESELASSSDRVLRFIEAQGFATIQSMMAHNSRHITLEDLKRVIEMLKAGGMIVEKLQGNQPLYQINDKGKNAKSKAKVGRP